jgi:predicted Zn finger-like uncharacterized protein
MESNNLPFPPLRLDSWGLCPHCSTSIGHNDALIDAYLQGGEVRCHSCRQTIDWWTFVVDCIIAKRSPFTMFSALGAVTNLFSIEMKPGEKRTIDLHDHGLPEDGRVLSLGYTPNFGNLFPLEVHGNFPERCFPPSHVTLYPMPVDDQQPRMTVVNVMLTWVRTGGREESWACLLDAAAVYAARRFPDVVIPANVAVEARMTRLVGQLLSGAVSRKRVRGFLTEAATYGHQLNVLLPALLSPHGVPMMPDHLRGQLNVLRRLRNRLSHEGVLKAPPDQESAAGYLAAAIFGFRYVDLVLARLEEKGVHLS